MLPLPIFITNKTKFLHPIIKASVTDQASIFLKILSMEKVNKMVSEKPIVIFSKTQCCMSHTIKSLFYDFGVNPTIYELDEMPWGSEIEQALSRHGCNPTSPVVFIGGEFIGGANEIMSLHLKRSLKPMLKRAGALWV